MAKLFTKKTFDPKELDIQGLPTNSATRNATTSIDLVISPGWNYMSFPYKGVTLTLNTIIPPATYPQITKVLGDTTSSTVVSGAWQGSANTLSNIKGYRIFNDSDNDVVVSISTPNGYGQLYGDSDLKWDLGTGNQLMAFPYIDSAMIQTGVGSEYIDDLPTNTQGNSYIPINNALAFTNHGQSIAGGGTGEIIESITSDTSAMDYIDEQFVGSLATQGFETNGAYWINLKNQPATEPFRYFRDPVPQPWDEEQGELYEDWASTPPYIQVVENGYPVDPVGFEVLSGKFMFTKGDTSRQNFIGVWCFYKWSKVNGQTQLQRPVVGEDWLGAFKGDVCVGSYWCIANNWSANTNGSSVYSSGSNLAFCVSLQSSEGFNGATVAQNCYDGDLVRFLFWDSTDSKYYMCKFYDHTLDKVLEWEDPLGNGQYEDVSKYMFSAGMLDGTQQALFPNNAYNNNVENALFFTNNGFQLMVPPTRFSLVAIPWEGNNWVSTTQ